MAQLPPMSNTMLGDVRDEIESARSLPPMYLEEDNVSQTEETTTALPPVEKTKAPEPLAIEVLPKNHVLLNGGNETQTISEFANMWQSRYGRASGDTFNERLASIESSGGSNLVNPRSRARGKYQWMPATAAEFGLDWDELNRLAHQGQAHPDEERAINELTARNRRHLTRALGREPEEWELYLAHQQGATGATRIIKATQRNDN